MNIIGTCALLNIIDALASFDLAEKSFVDGLVLIVSMDGSGRIDTAQAIGSRITHKLQFA